MTGFFVIDRGIWEHESFSPEPFTEREAWMWMISAAAWEDKKVRVGRAHIDLKRGQLAFSLRFLAEKFRWSESRVRRRINRHSNDAEMIVKSTHEATIITICNYDKYQLGRRADDRMDETLTDAKPTNPRRKEEELNTNNKQEERKKDTRANALRSDFVAFWSEWPNKVGRPAALKALGSAMGRGAILADILAGVRNYVRDKPPDRPWLNPSTFLNQNRWEDQPAQVQNGKANSISTACDNLVELVNRGFGGPASQDGVRSRTDETDVRLLSFRGSQ